MTRFIHHFRRRFTMKMKQTIAPALAAVTALGLLLWASNAQASISAGFDDGAGNTLVDQYPGVAGDGWSTAWEATSNASASVNNASPLNGGGNYLTATTDTASARGVKRAYTNFGDVDLSQVHVIKFDWRFDGNIANFASDSDRLYIADGSAGGLGESGATAFHIRAHGDDRGTANGGEWAVYNGDQDQEGDIDDNKWVNTGMAFQAGVVYTFTVTLDPANRTYDVDIDNGTTDVTVNAIGFKTSATTVAGTLNFMSRKSTGVDDLSYSIDSISIAVPEPASLMLLGVGAVLALGREPRSND